MKKVRLSTALEIVINTRLREPASADNRPGNWVWKDPYSCNCIEELIGDEQFDAKVAPILSSLGIDFDGGAFSYLGSPEDRMRGNYSTPGYDHQHARALWLTFVQQYLKDNPKENCYVEIQDDEGEF